MEETYCGSSPEEKLLGGLLVDVVHLIGAELARFLVGLGGVHRLEEDAGRKSGLGHAFALGFGGLDRRR